MFLNVEQVNEVKKKIVIDLYFNYSLNTTGISCKYNLLYDCGNGLQNVNLDSETYDFAMKITKDNYNNFSDTFGLSSDDYIAFENSGKDITNNSVKASLIKNLCTFANNIDVPLFVKINDQYIFLNDSKFTDYNKESEIESANNKYTTLDTLITDEAYGIEYDNTQKYKEDFKKLQRLARY